MIGQLYPPGEGARQQLQGWIIRREQQKFENKLYEVNGAAELGHRKSRWKLQTIIAQLKSTREGKKGNTCCWEN